MIDFIYSFISAAIVFVGVYCYDEHIRKKRWLQERDAWRSLLVDAQMEIKRLSGGDTKLTREIERYLDK